MKIIVTNKEYEALREAGVLISASIDEGNGHFVECIKDDLLEKKNIDNGIIKVIYDYKSEDTADEEVKHIVEVNPDYMTEAMNKITTPYTLKIIRAAMTFFETIKMLFEGFSNDFEKLQKKYFKAKKDKEEQKTDK